MRNVVAVLSMLHERADRNSATRMFRGRPVAAWTLDRLSKATRVDATLILCWEDQFAPVMEIAQAQGTHVLSKGVRTRLGAMEAVSAARRWADGWRGGLLGTCDFDAGFYGPWVKEIYQKLDSDAVVLVDPASALVDPKLVDELVEHAEKNDELELCFTPAAPGLAGVVIRPSLIDQLAAGQSHPGRLLHYSPGRYGLDPITSPACVAAAAPVARTLHRFKLDSHRQIDKINSSTQSLNGQLMSTAAEELVHRVGEQAGYDAMPREVVLELNVRRASNPVFWPGRYLQIDRPDLTMELAGRLFAELGQVDDLRLTLGGVGDPLLAENVFGIIGQARRSGIEAIHLETDLLNLDAEKAERLAQAEVDLISVRVPAMLPGTYEAVMGTAGLEQAMGGIRLVLEERKRSERGVPLLAPAFVKCRENLAEMEVWYDQWLGALGGAVICGPSDYAGQIADKAVADMSPPKRRACMRLTSRMSILCDGKVVSCEQDVVGKQAVGEIGREPVAELWKRILRIHGHHVEGSWALQPLCGACREWHRP